MIRLTVGIALPVSLLALSACDNKLPEAEKTGPVRIEGGGIGQQGGAALPGTPMAERQAVIGLLNKRNGLTTDLKMKPGEALRIGDAIVRLRACETTAPWENTPETGAFVQLDVRSPADNKWRRNFSGWLFKNRPDRNVVQHPVYDVWVKSCTMSWPETGPETLSVGGKGEAKGGMPGASTPASGSNASEAAEPGPTDSNARPAPSGTSATAAPSNDR